MAKDSKVNDYATVSITDTKKILERVFGRNQTRPNGQKSVPILLGPAGIGKTSLVRQVAEDLGYENMMLLRLSEMRPEDITGPPFPHKDGYSLFHPPLALLKLTKEYHDQEEIRHKRRVAELKKVIASAQEAGVEPDSDIVQELADMGETYKRPGRILLVLDELPNAPPEMQATAHSLVLDYEIGVEGYHLLETVDIVATGNRREDGAQVHRESNPMKTRLTPHLIVEPTPDEWQLYARRADIHPLIRAFLKNNVELMIDKEPKMDVMAYPTYRTWDKASELCYAFGIDELQGDSANVDKTVELLSVCLEGTVGLGAAASFVNFVRTARLAPSAEDIARDPKGIDVHTGKPDIQLVMVENMISGVRHHKEWAEAFITFGGRMPKPYQALLFPAMMNLDGDMPKEVIEEVLQHVNMDVYAVCHTIDTALKAGDEAAKQGAKQKR